MPRSARASVGGQSYHVINQGKARSARNTALDREDDKPVPLPHRASDHGKPPRSPILRRLIGMSRMALREGVSHFHQIVCVFRAPDNSDIILIFSFLYVA